MAKSKNGGSRAFIRGRIGSDVYSVGKNGQGARQQVVRSLAVQVSNPRTQSQMFGRMIMSTVMQAVSGMAQIIDHSFDGKANGQPSISEFIRRNYALIKADATAHPASGNKFGLVKFQEKAIKLGEYVISDGALVLDADSFGFNGADEFLFRLNATSNTVADAKAKWPVSLDGYVTCCYITDGEFQFFRVKLNTSLADDTVLTNSNVGDLFEIDSQMYVGVTYGDMGNEKGIKFSAQIQDSGIGGVIISDYVDGKWQHNTAKMYNYSSGFDFAADVALATYPTGTAQYLNGGDL